jgi:hypothetical protein
VAAGLLAGIGLAASPAAADPAEDKVTICHATSDTTNPYVQITVSASSLDGQGNNDHTQHTGPLFDFADPDANEAWGDIIPAGPGVSEAVNDTSEGQAILANGCNGPDEGSCPDGSDPVEGECPTEETCPGGEPAVGGECPEELEACETDEALAADDPACGVVPCETDPQLSADDPACGETDECPDPGADECLPAPVTSSHSEDRVLKPVEVKPSVIHGGSAAQAPTLPVTGRSTGPLAAAGTGLVALGAALLLAERRRLEA